MKEGWISPQPPLLKFTHPPATLVGGGDAIWLKAFAFFFGPDCWQLSKLPSIQEIFVCGTCWLEDTKERVIDIGICSFNTVSKTKSPGGFCVLRALLLVAISFPPKKTTKNTQKQHPWRKPAAVFPPAKQVEVGFASTLLGAMVFLMSLTYFTNHSDQDADFFGSSRIRFSLNRGRSKLLGWTHFQNEVNRRMLS